MIMIKMIIIKENILNDDFMKEIKLLTLPFTSSSSSVVELSVDA